MLWSKPFDCNHSTTSSTVHSDGCVPDCLPESDRCAAEPLGIDWNDIVVAGVRVCWIPAALPTPIEPDEDAVGDGIGSPGEGRGGLPGEGAEERGGPDTGVLTLIAAGTDLIVGERLECMEGAGACKTEPSLDSFSGERGVRGLREPGIRTSSGAGGVGSTAGAAAGGIGVGMAVVFGAVLGAVLGRLAGSGDDDRGTSGKRSAVAVLRSSSSGCSLGNALGEGTMKSSDGSMRPLSSVWAIEGGLGTSAAEGREGMIVS